MYSVADFRTNILDVATNWASLKTLVAGQAYRFFVTAYGSDGLESDPSDEVRYTVPAPPLTTNFSLKIGSFSNGWLSISPRGTLGPSGAVYPAGKKITLTAAPLPGALFKNWIINGRSQSGNPLALTLSKNTVATPVFALAPKTQRAALGLAQRAISEIGYGPEVLSSDQAISMELSVDPAGARIRIGGEAGAWTLESSDDLKDWVETASGITSDEVAIGFDNGHTYYRVRPRALVAFEVQP